MLCRTAKSVTLLKSLRLRKSTNVMTSSALRKSLKPVTEQDASLSTSRTDKPVDGNIGHSLEIFTLRRPFIFWKTFSLLTENAFAQLAVRSAPRYVESRQLNVVHAMHRTVRLATLFCFTPFVHQVAVRKGPLQKQDSTQFTLGLGI